VLNPESKAQGLPGLFLINVKQKLSTKALNSISMNLCLPYWKSQESRAVESGHPVLNSTHTHTHNRFTAGL